MSLYYPWSLTKIPQAMNYLIQWSESNPNSLQSMNSAPQKQNFLDKIRARVSDNLVPLQTADRVVALGLALRNIKIERKIRGRTCGGIITLSLPSVCVKIINMWKFRRTGMHKSSPALATIGPEGAYSFVSLESVENNLRNPFICCWACCLDDSGSRD